MSEEPPEKETTSKQSIKGYASKVFKESSVSVVSAILSTGSIPTKIFRALVFLIFTVGFLYQCIKFLSYVLTYPTVVTVEIRKPESFIAPAFTFCNHNKIKRSKFCAKYPERCVSPDAEFCDNYPVYCKENYGKKVPKEEYYLNDSGMSKDEVLELSHDLKDLLVSNYSILTEPAEGPFIRFRVNDGYDGLATCYTYRGRIDTDLDPYMQSRKSWWVSSSDEIFIFNPEEDEVFNPNSDAGVFLAIHSQYETANPFTKGIFLKPHYFYKIIISMHEEKLLEHPYKTDCLNYTKKWMDNNKRGPRSQEMCRQLCEMEAYVRCKKCIDRELEYPSNHRICTEEEMFGSENCKYDDLDRITAELDECFNGCKDECLKMKYDYEVQERKVLPLMENGTVQEKSLFIRVFIDIDDKEIYSFEYKPQYQEVEAFSYIGGFIGIWLGISLVQVADFFESAFRIVRYFFRKGSKCSDARHSA